MQQIIFISAVFLGAIMLAFTMVITATSSLQVARRWTDGILQYFFYALFISNSVMAGLSGRDYSGLDFSEPTTAGNPLIEWSLRVSSLFLMLAALDQCVRFFRTRPHIEAPRAALAFGIILLWLTNIVAPAYWSMHPFGFHYTWAYQPILIIGLLCLTPENGSMVIRHCRNAVCIFCLASLLLAVVHPSSVIDTNYQRGIWSGLPRLAGLATHPVTMGMISAAGIWCVLFAPFPSRKINVLGLLICGSALLLSQSKNTWIGLLLGIPVMIFYHLRASRQRGGSKVTALFAMGFTTAMLVIVALLSWLILGIAEGQVDRLSHSALGGQLASLTGRNLIWDVAIEEWRRAPVFGYGLNLFDFQHRLQIGMMFATDAHNQYLDALARSGALGATGAIIYCSTIGWLGLRYSDASRGLSLILAISLLARTVSEVPFVLTVTNLNDTAHYLFICVIVSCMRTPPTQKAPMPAEHPNASSLTSKPC